MPSSIIDFSYALQLYFVPTMFYCDTVALNCPATRKFKAHPARKLQIFKVPNFIERKTMNTILVTKASSNCIF